MDAKILANINNFVRNRLVEFLGVVLIFISIFLLASIASYSPSDPNFIYTPENTEIKNVMGFYGSVISDFLLQSLGLISIFLVINFFYWGIKLTTKKTISNFIAKIFFTFAYIVFGTIILSVLYNDSYWLIDNGNGGFVGRAIKENIYYFAPLIENRYLINGLILLAIIFFILSLSIKPNEIIKILLFPFTLIKKISNFIKRDKTKIAVNPNTLNVDLETENYEENTSKEK